MPELRHVDEPGGSVLVVDDTPSALQLLSTLLQQADYQVRAAPSGELALWSADAEPPELILLDVQMPGLDGYEVCRRLKRNPALCEIPVIFLSALGDTDDKLNGFAAGGVDFISKPYDFPEVHARVAAHLKLSRLKKLLHYQNEHLHELVEAKALELSSTHVALVAERSQRDVAERDSRQRLAEIAHMNRTAGASVYTAALVHELNQPLAAIMSNAEAARLMLASPAPPLSEIAEILDDIWRDNRRASELIRRMRDLLRKSDSASAAVDLNEVVLGTLDLLASEARRRSVQLTHRLTGESTCVLADPVQLQQVLINLVLNSMDAMSDSTGERVVDILTVRSADGNMGDRVIVQVCDRGCGFQKELDELFTPFSSTKEHGMGLGLTISQAIIHAHGGQIAVRDNPGGGAIVSFGLPFAAP